MDAYQWNTEFVGTYTDNYGDKIVFRDISSDMSGTFGRQRPEYEMVFGVYKITFSYPNVFLEWAGGSPLRLSFTKDGFDLFDGETHAYSLVRTV